MTVKQKREDQAHGIKYGCHVELNFGDTPDDCVKDYGGDADCVYAKRHRTREGCKYWQPVDVMVSP